MMMVMVMVMFVVVQSKDMINQGTSQADITEYRKVLQEFINGLTDVPAVGIAS